MFVLMYTSSVGVLALGVAILLRKRSKRLARKRFRKTLTEHCVELNQKEIQELVEEEDDPFESSSF